MFEACNAVPVDIRIMEFINLKIEKAALTGESYPVDKITEVLEAVYLPIGDKKNMAFKSTFATASRGTGRVHPKLLLLISVGVLTRVVAF